MQGEQLLGDMPRVELADNSTLVQKMSQEINKRDMHKVPFIRVTLKAHDLMFYNNIHDTTFKQFGNSFKLDQVLCHCLFTNMTQLTITNCDLRNCEILSLIYAPGLKHFYLIASKIVNIKALHKWHAPKLILMNIERNQIKEMAPLSRLEFPKNC